MIHEQQHLHMSHKEIADAAMCNEKKSQLLCRRAYTHQVQIELGKSDKPY